MPKGRNLDALFVQDAEILVHAVPVSLQVPGRPQTSGTFVGLRAAVARGTKMDSENDELLGVLFGQHDELFSSTAFPGTESGTFPLSEQVFRAAAEKLFEEWAIHENRALKDREEPDDLLQLMINPNDVYSSGTPMKSPESDSGISDDHRPDSPQHSDASPSDRVSAPAYEVIYNIGTVATTIKTEPVHSSVISIQLDDWNSPILVPESRVVQGLPPHTAAPVPKHGLLPLVMTAAELQAVEALYPELMLTDEEKRLLSQEGIDLPNNLPLTKAEERILKKVRRKIRNKQSAQDSRRRKKEYIDGLESRVAACSAQNQELHKKVLELEKHNVSLITQLRRLQTLIKQTTTKAAQTSTCILIFIFSLALLIFPSYSPFRSGSALAENGYRPTGVISRNILNEADSPEPRDIPAKENAPPAPHEPDWVDRAESWEPPHPSAPKDDKGTVATRRSIHSLPERLRSMQKDRNASDTVRSEETNQTGTGDPGSPTEEPTTRGRAVQKDSDLAKPIHADEM
ncbi:cyclic AMP-responsive element-binding protein 3-like protein 4 [Ambystoma mexicanum]|uniref:cyclic AMP-responsive element-binding protein 3-like protein 4 n=1 Tax=Ambystoma mexicanum TaxID=8296 RepID=UPI0037E8DBA0